MRISDWSSDVCSSDLAEIALDELVLAAKLGMLRHHFRDLRDQRLEPRDVRLGLRDALIEGRHRGVLLGDLKLNLVVAHLPDAGIRSAARRVGNGCVRTGRSRVWRYP